MFLYLYSEQLKCVAQLKPGEMLERRSCLVKLPHVPLVLLLATNLLDRATDARTHDRAGQTQDR